jgi:hypothetical protein
VTHTHWDREWYRTFEAFRARLVDAVDRVLDWLAVDEGWRFLLDGQTVVLEDYLEVRPGRREELAAACRAGRLGVGPWYVQPDSLLPSGEAHIRNLLEGRRTAETVGTASSVAYTPDSFGHPAQFPQLFCGFGLEPFVYWRGNGSELDDVAPTYRWTAPDGSAVVAHHLARGYFAAAGLPPEPDAAAAVLERLARTLATTEGPDMPVLLMNGFDHTMPDTTIGEAAAALARRTGWTVRRGLLDDLRPALGGGDLPAFAGELLGARVANLLPGVWSTRMGLKLANRRAESALEGWAEPWAALAWAQGGPEERPALRLAWRSVLQSQAHDSICGCSQDLVAADTEARARRGRQLGDETTRRALERVAGLGTERRVPWSTELDLAVFNPSPRARTDLVRFPFDGFPLYRVSGDDFSVHPLVLAGGGFTVDGVPARVVAAEDPSRPRMLPEVPPLDVEFVARDVPAFGWRRVRLAPGPEVDDVADNGREIAADDIGVVAAADGTLTVSFGARSLGGLAALEDRGDRGDTYDFDPVPNDAGAELVAVRTERRRHPSGIERLVVTRTLSVPQALAPSRSERSTAVVPLDVVTEAVVAPGMGRVDLGVRVENTAADHRLRLLFPTGHDAEEFSAATTFDVARRRTRRPDDSAWVHAAPATFPHQGWVSANGLTVAAPGLPEAEVTPGGVVAVTLLRAVGWLARLDVTTRPIPAGPGLPTPGAQCRGPFEAGLALLPDVDLAEARAAELGLRAVPAGDEPLVAPGRSLLSVEPAVLVLSALKQAEREDGIVVRLLNPTDAAVRGRVRLGFPAASALPVRLDETPAPGGDARLDGDCLQLSVGARRLESVLLFLR